MRGVDHRGGPYTAGPHANFADHGAKKDRAEYGHGQQKPEILIGVVRFRVEN